MKRRTNRRDGRSSGRRRIYVGERLERRELLAANVVINEIHYDPADKTKPLEFVELFNGGDAADLSGWRLSGAIDFAFPAGTQLPAGGYLVVAENPAALLANYGAAALGPFTGSLSNDGEKLELIDGQGLERDQVNYGAGFPWPSVGDDRDASIQLIHPGLDNDLGGSWRSTGAADPAGQVLVEASGDWKYFKGTQAPPTGWAGPEYIDTSWSTGTAPLGYGETFIATPLADMRGSYSTVYLRKSFTVVDPAEIGRLLVEAVYDDGINIWLNGQLIVSSNVPSGDLPYTATSTSAVENLEFVPFELPAGNLLRSGTNVLAIQLLNSSLGGSSDAFIDARLVGYASTLTEVTPGSRNSVYSLAVPPQVRQVDHWPAEPTTATPVTVTAKATDPDGVQRLTLYYQLVPAGDYFSTDSARYESEWTTIAMRDDGLEGDSTAGDGTYSVVMPASLQQHRALVRYRIVAEDSLGTTVRVPYADDSQPNFAYYVYDGVPDWTGAARPGVTTPVTYSSEMLGSLPVYQLLTTRKAHEDSQFIPSSTRSSGYTGSEYLWRGTLVYDGQVYDHINYRARGGVWRYSMGKNMWKFDFNRGHSFQARDDYGRRYDTKWDKLNFSALIQQGDYLHRGEQGLFESVGFDLFNLAGVEAPHTHFLHFRIVEDGTEGGADQYSTDFQGLYLAIEQPDGNMLDEHDLPDGNYYKMESGTGTLNNQGPTQPTDRSDLDAFLNTYQSGTQTADWWRANLDLDRYYSYRSIVEAIHHYDIADGKNYFYYHNPETGKWQVHPWDLDLTWADNMYGSGQEPFFSRVSQRAEFAQDYRNRLREIFDLLYNPEQAGWLIDDKVRLIQTPGQPSWVDADRAMWDYNPILASSYVNSSKAGQGRFYQRATTKNFTGMVQLMKNYVRARQQSVSQRVLTDSSLIPQLPVAQYLGQSGFPINDLVFQSSPFVSPSGSTLAGLKWRIAEVRAPGIDGFDPTEPSKLEINATWESGLLTDPNQPIQIPTADLKVGKTYRVRVRQLDAAGRWSSWSGPVQFVVGSPAGPLTDRLKVTELYYHPTNPTAEELVELPGATDEQFEYLELTNVGTTELDLNGVKFTEGVKFDFSTLADTRLPAGQSIVLAADPVAYRLRFGPAARVAGPYVGQLDNGGELLRMTDAQNLPVLDLTYDDDPPWAVSADGGGDSLQLVDAVANPNLAASWQAAEPTPGRFGSGPVATFVGARPFYDGTSWDGFDPGLGQDDAAIPGDKSVLLAGQTVGPQHIIAHPAGITGMMVDIQGLPAGESLSLADFTFRTGTGGDVAQWQPAPLPEPLTADHIRRGAGASGADRIELIWAPGAVVNQWLQVTVLANARTGLAEPVVFYLGSLVGDTANDSGPFIVDGDDRQRVVDNQRSFLLPATIDLAFDVNRDRLVDGTDLAIVRDRQSQKLELFNG